MKKSSTTSTPEHPAMPEAQRGHKTIDEVAECPTCKAKLIEKFKPDIEKDLRIDLLKEFKEKFKNKTLVTCDGCGEIVNKSDIECPTCHGKHAH